MRLLIIGASGLVGNALYNESIKREHKTLGTYLSFPVQGLEKLDYGDSSELKKILDSFLPEVIICPAGITKVDWIEEHPKEAWEINVSKLKVLFEVAKERKIKVVFFSTDYIFDGKSGPYSEKDIPNPINIYGKHKLESEAMLTSLLQDNFLTIRTTWIFGYEIQGKNFVYSILKNLRDKKEMKVPKDLSATSTYVKDLARWTLGLIEKGYKGIFNIANPEYMSRFEFAKSIAKEFGLDIGLLTGVKCDSLKLSAKRPMLAGLKNDKVNKAISPKWTPLVEALQETKKEMEEAKQLVYEYK